MPAFAPPYNPSKHQQSFLARQEKAQSRKRKREQDSSDDEDATPEQASPEPEPTPRTAASAFHPVNKTDPFYIAGHPRELPLPPPPFPHAAVQDSSRPKSSVKEELASLKPPLYVPPKTVEDKSTSLRRRHLDNVTAILHRSMLKGDWKRAHRAWGLLIRTEVNGRGIDVRRHGRWGIGAELLMREGGREANIYQHQSHGELDDDAEFTNEGLKLARSYYERLILQYPHTQHTQHHLNATAIYPALFNIWIYSAQDSAKRARRALDAGRASSVEDSPSGTSSHNSHQASQIRTQEIDEATAIAGRIDELLVSPPYDTDTTLRQLRGNVALWLSDLHSQASASTAPDRSETSVFSEDSVDTITVTHHKPKASAERRKALEAFTKLDAQGVPLPPSTRQFLENDEDE